MSFLKLSGSVLCFVLLLMWVSASAQTPQSNIPLDLEAVRHELVDPLHDQIWQLQKRILVLSNEVTSLTKESEALKAELKQTVGPKGGESHEKIDPVIATPTK